MKYVIRKRWISVLFLLIVVAPTLTMAAQMNNQYAMVFFFRSDCGYCHLFAPKLKQFEQQTGLFTYAFSIDGKGLPEYPVPFPTDMDTSRTFFENPRSITVPATFFINVNTMKFVRVSVGNVSLAQLQSTYNNIMNDPHLLESLQ